MTFEDGLLKFSIRQECKNSYYRTHFHYVFKGYQKLLFVWFVVIILWTFFYFIIFVIEPNSKYHLSLSSLIGRAQGSLPCGRGFLQF